MRIYLSGPISGLGPEEVRAAFGSAAEQLRKRFPGCEVIDPSRLEIKSWTWRDYMRCWVQLLANGSIDMVAMLPNWRCSRGATAEHRLANILGLQILYL